MDAMRIYNRLPVFAQNLAFSAAGWRIQQTRYGAGFHQLLSEFESHLDWNADQLAAWQNEKIRSLVQHAYLTVPYYRVIMDDGGIDPRSIKCADDLKRFPILTKDIIKAMPDSFVSVDAKKYHPIHVHTSGTTGSGFQFLSTIECRQAQFACFWRYYRQHGITLDTWEAQFSSRNAVPASTSKPPFWRVDYPGKRYYMSAFHESPANLESYYELIKRKRFTWISGYPSLMVLLAQWMIERGYRYDFVKHVSCGAENLLEHQASAIERAFGVAPVQTYGQTENVAIFTQQPDGKILVDEDFSIVEFLASDSQLPAMQVVGTCLYNYATPLIRYCTNDMVELGDQYGTRREVASIDGRREDYVSLPDGTKVGKLDHVFKDTPNFREAQIYQRADYSIILRVCGNEDDCHEDEKTALEELRRSLSCDVPIEFEYVSAIERSGARKLRFVVSEAR